jgi:hypothetical protein
MATKQTGSCHCGKVRYQVEIDLSQAVNRCNCTICAKTATTNAIVKPAAFTLIEGKSNLGEYVWGGKTMHRFFCKDCGVHCYGTGYLEQVGGAYVAVNLNTLDSFDVGGATIVYWDGRHDNWAAGTRDTPWPIS